MEELEPSYRAISESAVRQSVAGLPLGALRLAVKNRSWLPGHLRTHSWDQGCGPSTWDTGRRDPSQAPWCLVVVAGSGPYQKVPTSTGGQNCVHVCNRDHGWHVSHLGTACILKMALLGLRRHCDFAVPYLDPKALIKALLSMDGCHITVAEGGIHAWNILLHHSSDIALPESIFFKILKTQQ